METFKVIRIRDGKKETVEDVVAREVPFTLNIGDKELVTLLCTPCDLQDLATGFLFTSGLIKKAEDIRKISIDQEKWAAYIQLDEPDTALVFKRLYTSGCGRGTLFYSAADIISREKIASEVRIEAKKISALMTEFQKRSEMYLNTGGAHSAALADDKGMLVFKEDIGRHNAIDKVIGQRLREAGGFEDKIMVTSGRISSEVLFKIQKCRIPVIASKSAPTNQAIRLAQDMNVTLVAFVRGQRMNIYSAEERIIHGDV